MAASRIYANIIQFSWTTGSGDAISTSSNPDAQLAEVDKFSWKWNSTVDRTWPSGAKVATNYFTDGPISVTMTGGQVDTGFYGVVQEQRVATKQGKAPRKITLVRTALDANNSQLFKQTFTGGVASDASGDQTEGNKQISNMITFTFDDMS